MPLLCLTDQYDEMSDEELEEIAQREMMEYMIMHVPIRFDKDLEVGTKLVYASKYDENDINSVEVIKDTLNAFWIKEIYDGNIIYYLIRRDDGELLDIKGYDEEGRFNHPEMLSSIEKEIIRSKREEKKESLRNNDFFTLSSDLNDITIKNKTYSCKRISHTHSRDGEGIFVSNDIPRIFPFSFSMELDICLDVFSDIRGGLVKSSSVEIIEISSELNNED